MDKDESDDRRKIEVSEGQVVRWLCYVGFFFCVISLVISLSTGGSWIGFLLGSAAFGIPALKMYVLYQANEHTRADQAQWRAQHGGGQSKGWSLDNDDSGDPTVPPRGNR